MFKVGDKCIFKPKYYSTLSEDEELMFYLNDGYECTVIGLDDNNTYWVKLSSGHEFCVMEEELE